MGKSVNLDEVVWAKKEGFPRRKFTRRNLEAMGTDNNGITYDGWAIVDEVEEPEEVKTAREKVAAEAKEKAEKSKAEKSATKTAAEKEKAVKSAANPKTKPSAKEAKSGDGDKTPVVPLNPSNDTPTVDAGADSATKTDADNGQNQLDPEKDAERGAESTDVGGPAAAPGGEGN